MRFKIDKDWDFIFFDVFLCVILFVFLMFNYPNFWVVFICCILVFYMLKILHFIYRMLRKVVMIFYDRYKVK